MTYTLETFVMDISSEMVTVKIIMHIAGIHLHTHRIGEVVILRDILMVDVRPLTGVEIRFFTYRIND